MRIPNQSAGVMRTAFAKSVYLDVSAVNSGRIGSSPTTTSVAPQLWNPINRLGEAAARAFFPRLFLPPTPTPSCAMQCWRAVDWDGCMLRCSRSRKRETVSV